MNPSNEHGAARAAVPTWVEIHPTAIVHPKAKLGVSVRIGPFSVVGENAVIGDRSEIGTHVLIDGYIEMGEENQVFHGAALGSVCQDLKFDGGVTRVRIGDRNTFREYVTVNAATGDGESTVIGNDNLLMAYVHVAHNCVLGDHVILSNAVNMAGHVELHDYAIVGGVTPIHQFVRIGAHCFIGGGSRVPQDVPPYVKVAGNPLKPCGLNTVGMDRRGFGEDVKTELNKVYKIFYRSGLNTTQAMERIGEECRPLPEVERFLHFVKSSIRGVSR